ncbi:uncharacterized protein LOC120635783 [Pararge aegeria]|uniref:uncharacterized protein LOC120635783 n=1 Tax=Pararge aegeria TaxID=116150 RepID=UPI0019D112DA|nr:uncharacterized protein LOC120635783 [Pararge aegeria]
MIKTLCCHLNDGREIESNEKGLHLKYEHVKKVCSNRHYICKSNDTAVCTRRLFGGKIEHLDFENSCYLFLFNMCDDFENEYSIVSSGNCSDYLKSRRNNPALKETTKTEFISTKKAARAGAYNFSALYEVETAFDFHTCPMACPPIYSPVCVNVNRGHGLYFKFMTFVNHCVGDLYYCQHWEEFKPPPGENELVKSSTLSWSLCAANRFIQFARFTEMTSSMGHYGWLAGDYRPTYILKPHERNPKYG